MPSVERVYKFSIAEWKKEQSDPNYIPDRIYEMGDKTKYVNTRKERLARFEASKAKIKPVSDYYWPLWRLANISRIFYHDTQNYRRPIG